MVDSHSFGLMHYHYIDRFSVILISMNESGGRGFTIVEILVVIVVIAIIAAITIVAYNGIIERTTYNRAMNELSSLHKATLAFHALNERYPNDVARGIPSEIAPFINGSADSWPNAPWPDNIYDYDYFVGSDGNEAVQMSIRFCPAGGPLSACRFPNEAWASDFQVNSSAYWCITGKCRAHSAEDDLYPAYCLNCNH